MTQLPIPRNRPAVVFTDLDGTLLDHHRYTADAAADALRRLRERGWPVVFCSSKTFAEQVELQQKLGLAAPFIIENGSAVVVPRGYFSAVPVAPIHMEGYEVFPLAHADALSARAEIAHFQGVQGFYDISDVELSAATGLTGEALVRARARWFTETLVTPLDAGQVDALGTQLSKNGWVLSKGGRFYTVQSANADKGRAMLWLADIFSKNLPEAPLLVAVGDSPNDLPMLAAAHLPFLVQRHNGTWSDLEVIGLRRVEGIGPAGFSVAVQMLLGS